MQRGAIILCGGQSLRMGTSKAMLPFGPERMLQRVVRLVAEAVPVSRIVIISAADQPLPELPNEVTITHDRQPNRGPLEGLACGFAALPPTTEAAYLTGCDSPLLTSDVIEHLFSMLGECDAVVPRDENFYQPLAAVYRTRLLGTVEAKLADNQLALQGLVSECDTKEFPVEKLREIDPELNSLRNINTLEDYREALQVAGLPFSEDLDL